MTLITTTYSDIVRQVAAEFGASPDNDEVAWILWENTGFPEFWSGDPAESCRDQVRSFYENAAKK